MTNRKTNPAQISMFHYYLTKGVLKQSTDTNVQEFISISENDFVVRMYDYAVILEEIYLSTESNVENESNDFVKVIESLCFWLWSEICITYKLPTIGDFLNETRKALAS
ncbi:hypothetical protein DS885_03935 [Psychromonas sp. B3M02]|uniref:hypothetical protein n=1 Tax=Psychromonas sp. B3M02 TaxID=2267226 RepID=UPI000DEBCA54|nr:hypothetical protein [Psychromonas sp. B3M02]RBW47307.1 hypothetical protein DS885_03935 [Psychromonas sp. B3M02]